MGIYFSNSKMDLNGIYIKRKATQRKHKSKCNMDGRWVGVEKGEVEYGKSVMYKLQDK